MKLSLVVLLALSQFLILNAATATAPKEKTDAQYWEESGWTIDHLGRWSLSKLVYSDSRCNAEFMLFNSCHAMVDTLAAALKPTARLVTKDYLAQMSNEEKGKTLKVYGEFILMEVPKTKVSEKFSLRVAVQKRKAEIEKLQLSLKKVFSDQVQRLNSQTKEISQSKTESIPFEQILNDLRNQLKANPENQGKLAMIAGLAFNQAMIAVDAHASMTPTALRDSMTQAPDKVFFGIGAELSSMDGKVIVHSLRDGTAKSSKKIKVGDIITKISGKDLTGLDLAAVVDLIKGEVEGELVSMEINRKGTRIEISIPRGRVSVKNVESRIVDDLGAKYGYLKLGHFMDQKGCTLIAGAIESQVQAGVKGFILDFRGNPGGDLRQGQCLAGLFLGNSVVVIAKDLGSGQLHPLYGLPVPGGKDQVARRITDLPLVVLLNGGSASASELVAGALQDEKRAWIVGETSFGKGSVQSGGELEDSSLKLVIMTTVARFYQPSGRTNQSVGIEPDFTVAFKPNATEDERFVPRESDNYLNALSATGPRWKQTRASDVSRINSCRQAQLAQKKYSMLEESGDNADFQILAAQEILSCDH